MGYNQLTNAALGGCVPSTETQQVCDAFRRCHVNHKALSNEQEREEGFIYFDIPFLLKCGLKLNLNKIPKYLSKPCLAGRAQVSNL